MHFGPSLRHGLQLSLAFAALLGAAEAARAEARAPDPVKPTQVNFAIPSHKAPDGTLGGDLARTRFLIGLDHSVEFQVFSLSNPNRVIVDLPEIALKLPNDPGGQAVGLVRSFRAGMSAPGKARIVIDVTQPVVVESAKVVPTADGKSHHLALDIVPVEAVTKAAKKPFLTAPYSLGAAGLQPPLPLRATRPDIRAAKAFKPVIVIDPGHGGHDSGAMKNGAVEKDVVLAFSKVFREKLEKTGRYKVMLTRDKDVFVELGDRVSYAERNKANLFIAVHADYSDDNSRARGATIYSLREFDRERARALDQRRHGIDHALEQRGRRGEEGERRRRLRRRKEYPCGSGRSGPRPHERAHQHLLALGHRVHGHIDRPAQRA